MYLVELTDGEAKGRHLIRRVDSYWFFKLSSGKWAYYFTNDSKGGHLTVAEQAAKRTGKQKNQPQAMYKFNKNAGLKDEDNRDVQTFLKWYAETFGTDGREECDIRNSRTR